jgi:hypothetical protein
MAITKIAQLTGRTGLEGTTFTVPAGVTSSHFCLAMTATADSYTVAPATALPGFTVRVANPSQANNSGISVLTRLGGMTAGDTLTFTPPDSSGFAYYLVWFDTGGRDVALTGAVGGRSGTSSSTVTIPSITTTSGGQDVLVVATERTTADGTTITGWSPSAPIQDLFLEEATQTDTSCFIGHFTQATAGATPAMTATYSGGSGNGAGVALALGSAVGTLTDDFTTKNTAKWGWGAGAAVASGRLSLPLNTSYSGYITTADVGVGYDLTNSSLLWQVAQYGNPAGTSGQFYAKLDIAGSTDVNTLSWVVNGGTLVAQRTVGGTTTQIASIPGVNATAHGWLRIAHAGTTVTWSYSADGRTWTAAATWSPTFSITNMWVSFGAGYWDSAETAAGNTPVLIDNVNLPPAAAPAFSGSLALTGAGTLGISGAQSIPAGPPQYLGASTTGVPQVGVQTRTLASMTVNAGDLLVMVAGTNNSGVLLTTPTGQTGFTWTRVRAVETVTNQDSAYIWSAVVTQTQTFTPSLSSTTTGAGQAWVATCIRFAAGTHGGIGASNSIATTTTTSVQLATTKANSAIVVVEADRQGTDATTRGWWNNQTAGSANYTGPVSDLVYQRASTASPILTYFDGYYANVGPVGTKSVGLTTPPNMFPTIVAVEVLAATAYSGSLALTGSGTLSASGVVTTAFSGTRAATGSGTVTLAGTPRPAGALALTGSGTLAASGFATFEVGPSGDLVLAGEGSLTLSGFPTFGDAFTGTVDLTAYGQLTLAGQGHYQYSVFATPTQDVPFRLVGRLFGALPRGLTVWRSAGQWHTAATPSAAQLADADVVYQGGRLHVLTPDQQADLVAAGFGDNIQTQEIVT